MLHFELPCKATRDPSPRRGWTIGVARGAVNPEGLPADLLPAEEIDTFQLRSVFIYRSRGSLGRRREERLYYGLERPEGRTGAGYQECRAA